MSVSLRFVSACLCAGFVWAVLLFGPVRAETIDGQFDPTFLAAVELWLADDEPEALPQLARLAKGGNIAARMLVAMIDKTPDLQGPWLSLRSRHERIALLRASGGLSGTSWIRQADGLELARLWIDILDSRGGINTALAFSDFGEERAVRAGLMALSARQVTGFAKFETDERFPAAARFLIWREWQREGGRESEIDGAIASLVKGDPQRRLFGTRDASEAFETWFENENIGQPLRQLCQTRCIASAASCTRAGFRTIGGYGRLIMLGSPVATLISEERFAASQRGQASVLRRALTFTFLNETTLAAIADTNACFANLLSDEWQRF